MNNLVDALTVLVTQFFLGLYVFLLVELREPKGRWIAAASALVAGNVLWIAICGIGPYQRVGFLSLLVPYMMITLWCSEYRDARTLFGVSNASYVGCICGINGYVAQLLFPDLTYLPLFVRIVFLIAMFFVMRRFSRTCRAMVKRLEHGWIVLWSIPLTTSVVSMYLGARFFWQAPLITSIAIYGLLIVCGAAYYLMYLFFEKVETENEMLTNERMLSLQVSGLQSRIQAVNTAEEKMRMYRHDLRHRLQLITELLQKGESGAALEFLEAAQQRLDEAGPVRWCAPPILDAVFSSFFAQAQEQKIRVDAHLSFPDPLPVDEGELAIVLSNALENAIHACRAIPEGERVLRCVVIARPGLMLEVSNSCRETVRFDAEGLPISKQAGHGLGTRSIAAFCQKYSAVFQFKQTDNDFIVQIIL